MLSAIIDHSSNDELDIDEEFDIKAKKIQNARNKTKEFANLEPIDNLEKYIPKAVIKEDAKVIRKAKSKRLKHELRRKAEKYRSAAISAAKAEILLPEESGFIEVDGMEKTYKITQEKIKENVNLHTSNKMYDLNLPDFGPYVVNYSRNGRNIILAGSKGHIAIMDTLRMKLSCEFHVRETIRDATFLHNHSMFAIAQRKYVYLYNNKGAEIHCLREMFETEALEFLPYHYLLASIGARGRLRYQDVSTGKFITEHKTKLGLCNTMKQNKSNAVISLGHTNGIVTMWTPNMNEAVIKMQCHQGPVKGIAMDHSGKYMLTTGLDRKLKVWDLRTYKEVQTYNMFAPITSLDWSQRGLLAIGINSQVQIWKDFTFQHQNTPYLISKYGGKGPIHKVVYQPFEDVLSVTHQEGLNNMIVPGSGEPNFDTFEANPFESNKQQRETEVHSLLEKLRPEMITLDTSKIASIKEKTDEDEFNEKKIMEAKANNKILKIKNKARGKSSLKRGIHKKQKNVIDQQKDSIRRRNELEKKKKDMFIETEKKLKLAEEAPQALSRFFK